MRVDTIPFADGELRTRVRITWDINIVKLPGGERWRWLVLVNGLARLDGTPISGSYKVFVHFKNAGHSSIAWDARAGYIATNPFTASAIEAEAISAERGNYSDDISILFKAYSTQCVPLGVQKASLIRDSKNPIRAIASEDVRVCEIPTHTT